MANLFKLTEFLSSKIDIQRLLKAGEVSGLFGTAKAAFLAAFSNTSSYDIVFAAKNADIAEQIYCEVKLFAEDGKQPVYFFSNDDLPENLAALFSMLSGEKSIIVTTQDALFKKTYKKDSLLDDTVRISKAERIDTEYLIKKLSGIGYERVFMVEDSGEFSVRGGIIDVFLKDRRAVRIEFSDDKAASIREFDTVTQRSIRLIENIEILPVREKKEEEFHKNMKNDTVILMDEAGSADARIKKPSGKTVLELNAFPRNEGAFNFECRFAPEYSSMIEPFIDDLKAGREETFIISKQDSRLKELFIDAGLLKESIRIVHGEIPQGFHLPKEGIALFSDREIFGEHIPRRRFKVQAEKAVPQKFYADYRKGDAVVHKDYGIGIYEGIDKQTVDSVSSDYLYLRFAGDDRLYIPVQQINLISKYNVPGDHIPRLNSLGGSEWRLIKRRAKKSIRDMTKELLETYSSRKSGSGHSFPPDDAWQAELESSFPYEDTPDQTEAVRAVKKDMESDKPMDRLLCADVGYGKTEVALRAAFKAASSGKQVCFLCPTTILAQQHSRLFQARFAPFPFAVEVLSRFKSHSEQKELLKKTESGSIDVIIGTHRLLQNDVKFKDLGLLIIDEEQRFGVAHKEKIKRLKKNVDVLNLSATPIPRTLYMAVSGIWDMSLITTPPPGRSMIETCVLPWRASTVKQAIEKEKERGGQVFYVFNSVEKIGDTAKKLGKILPSISVAVAHGRMKPDELERIMMDFVDGKYDVLLSTTIIESGLDIPNVNTIIIENPDKFGLSTLYQLRGRVGRSNVKAFAYLLYRETSVLTERSLERLQAIKSFTALGSGYRIAMRDLEIRGAGNVLGSQQHGHMLAIGSDLYCDLLKEAAAHFKGEKTPIKHTTLVDLKINAFIPDHFIEDEVERIAVYKRLNLADNFKEVKDLEDELVDRFGHLPLEAVNMLEIVRIKISASSAGIKKITQKNNDLIIELGSEKRLIGIAGSSEKEILSRIEKFVKESDSQVSV